MPPTENVPDAELSVLEALWEDGDTTIRSIADRLYPDGGVSGYATVQKLLERLIGRELVDVVRGGRANLYRAVIDRAELAGRQVEQVAEKLCGGSLVPLFSHLMRAERLDASERRELRELLQQLERRTGRSRSRRKGR